MTAGLPVLRETPEDFRVDEVLAYEPSGEGGHTYIHVEKRLLETDDVARILARAARVRPADVGYAGRKDRRSISTQWFSVPDLEPAVARAIEAPGLRVIDAVRHPHKLRVGRVRANRFDILLRGVEPDVLARARLEAATILDRGLANRFGPQRFGRGGRNVERALALVRGELRERDRRKARFLYSALQAFAFNAVLDARPLPLDAVELGDIAQVVASGGLFEVEDLEREAPRARAFEISPTGPIFGPKSKQAGAAVGERERDVLASLGLEHVTPPRGVRARGDRRPLRVPVPDLRLEATADGVRLVFTLPSGSYATVLVEALFGEVAEAHGSAEKSEEVTQAAE